MAARAKIRPSKPANRHHNSVETRAVILEAAERIFAEDGLAGARTDAIAAAAGVNKALLYYYFKSKDDLYVAVLEEHFKEFRRQAMEVLTSEGPAGETLLRYVDMHFDFISSRPYYPSLFQRMAMAGGKSLGRLARDYFVPLSQKFFALIERGIRSGELRPFDIGHTAISLVALTVFYFSAAPVIKVVGGQDPYSQENLARRKQEVLKFIRHALFNHPEAKQV